MKGRPVDSNAKALRVPIAVLLGVMALCASAAAGAWVHARYVRPAPVGLVWQQPMSEQVSQASRETGFLRENLGVLATKLGDLQARIIEVDGLGKRVAEAAGVTYTDPEIQAALDETESAAPVMDYIDADPVSFDSPQGLGLQLDALQKQVSAQKDWFSMLDMALTRRTGLEASLPTVTPVNYPYLSSSFGWRRHPITGRHVMHEGLDFSAPTGTPIHAASGGVVTWAASKSGYGKMVEINHGNGLVTRYAHASKVMVKRGDLVEKGQLIAKVGSTGQSTGPHLHFEVRMAGHPLDPTLFLARPDPSPSLMADASGHMGTILSDVR